VTYPNEGASTFRLLKFCSVDVRKFVQLPAQRLSSLHRDECLAPGARKELRMDNAPKSVSSIRPQACRSATLRQRVADEQMRRTESKTIDLRAELSKALQAGRFTQALDLYELIEKRKPDEPRWAHRKGDLLRRMGRQPDALIAYERAVHLYSAKGFDARATATAKLVLALDPNKGEVLEWADSVAARRFEQQSRNAIQLTY
jgi:tetratricopeptide (TPR) repeat protein